MATTDEGPHADTRGGPVPLSSDSWDFDPDEDLPNDPYRGVRRAGTRRRHWLWVAAVALVAMVVTIVWIATAGRPGGDNALWGSGDETSSATDPSDADTGPSASALPSTVVSALPAHPTTTVKPFTTLVYEAEAGMPDVKLRGAQVVSQSGASGGKAVTLTGDSGEIQLRNVVVPSAGSYRFAIYYAPGAAARPGELSVGNSASVAVTFAGGSGCCSVITVDVALPAGTYQSTIALSTGDGTAPAVDRVVISRP